MFSMRPSHSERGQAIWSFLDLSSPDAQRLWIPIIQQVPTQVREGLLQTGFFSFQFLTFICISGGLIKIKMNPLLSKVMTIPSTNIRGWASDTAVTPSNMSISLSCQVLLLSCQKSRTFYRHFCPFNCKSTISCSKQQILKIPCPSLFLLIHSTKKL